MRRRRLGQGRLDTLLKVPLDDLFRQHAMGSARPQDLGLASRELEGAAVVDLRPGTIGGAAGGRLLTRRVLVASGRTRWPLDLHVTRREYLNPDVVVRVDRLVDVAVLRINMVNREPLIEVGRGGSLLALGLARGSGNACVLHLGDTVTENGTFECWLRLLLAENVASSENEIAIKSELV